MMRKLAVGGGVASVLGLGLWLWSHHGPAVFMDAMIAFCT